MREMKELMMSESRAPQVIHIGRHSSSSWLLFGIKCLLVVGAGVGICELCGMLHGCPALFVCVDAPMFAILGAPVVVRLCAAPLCPLLLNRSKIFVSFKSGKVEVEQQL